jgi:ankyrin repeat protein
VLLKTLLGQKDVKGNTPLHMASIHGIPHIKDLLALYDKNYLAMKNEEGQTPFHLAARYGHVAIVELMLQMDKSMDQISLPVAKACCSP